jgi:hypothetical protein
MVCSDATGICLPTVYLCLYRGMDASKAWVILLQPRVGLRWRGSDCSEPNAVFDLRKKEREVYKYLRVLGALRTSSYGFRSRDLYIIALFWMRTEPSRPVHDEVRNWSAATSPSRTIMMKIPLIMTAK